MKLLITLFGLISLNISIAQTTIYLVRHAEKESEEKNPSLTVIGRFRAENIAKTLASVGITHIFSTDYVRTQETAAPLAQLLNLDIQSYNPSKLDEFSKYLLTINGVILVVGHSNTTPELTSLISQKTIDAIKENEYDNLYQVILVDDKIMLNRFRTIPSYFQLDSKTETK